MKNTLLVFFLIQFFLEIPAYQVNLLKKLVEIGAYKPDLLYAWTKIDQNPFFFGFSYSSLRNSSPNLQDYLKDLPKNPDKLNNLRENEEILLNNHENLCFFPQKSNQANEYLINDGISTHEKNIKDEQLSLNFNFKSLKNLDSFSIYLDIDGNSIDNEYFNVFFYVYSPNNLSNYTFLDNKMNDIIIGDYIRFKILDSPCREAAIGFLTYSLKIETEFKNQIDEILLNVLNNKPFLPIQENEIHSNHNLLFLQAIIPNNLKCEMFISQSQVYKVVLNSIYLNRQIFTQEFEIKKNKFTQALSSAFLNKSLSFKSYELFFNKFTGLFSNHLGSLGHFSGQIPFEFSLKDSPLFKTKKDYSLLSYESYSLFSHGFGLFLTCKYDLLLCASLIKNLLDQVNFMGWLPIHLNFPVNSSFPKEKETLTAPPTFLMAIEYISRSLFENRNSDDKEIKEILHSFLRLEVYPKLQLIFKYYLYSFRRLPGKFENFKTPYFHWNDGIIGDYPRIFQKDNTVEHLDLICWITDINFMLMQLANQYGFFADVEEYDSLLKEFLLKEFPYKYIGKTKLNRLTVPRDILSVKYFKFIPTDKTFSTEYGFSNLLPLIKGLITSQDGLLDNILELIINEKFLGSTFGVKIISLNNSNLLNFISLECNWLILRGLKLFYWAIEKPRLVYMKIREKLLGNVMRHFNKNGKIYDKYRTDNGNPIGEESKIGVGLVMLIINEDFY